MSTMAYGWVLSADSVSGGKVYQVGVAGDLVIVGWGAKSAPSLQYKVEKAGSPAEAQETALKSTELKEHGGYVLTIAPRAYEIDPSMLAELERMVGRRGRNERLQQAFTMLLAHGSVVA